MDDDLKRYHAAAHAMQTGVAHQINVNPEEAGVTPKHLRVGINAAMADHAGLVTLLIEKGVFTREEYVEAVAESMEEERDRYQAKMPKNVTLV